MKNEIKLLRYSDVTKLTGLSRSTIWRYWRSGRFPKPRRVGMGASLWLESDLVDWFANLEDSRSSPKQSPSLPN